MRCNFGDRKKSPKTYESYDMIYKHDMPHESELYRIEIEAEITEEDMKKAFPNRK